MKVAVPLIKIERRTPKSAFLGWGKYAYIRTQKETKSPRLLKFRSCVAGALKDKKFENLKAVQEAFRSAVKSCKTRVSEVV